LDQEGHGDSAKKVPSQPSIAQGDQGDFLTPEKPAQLLLIGPTNRLFSSHSLFHKGQLRSRKGVPGDDEELNLSATPGLSGRIRSEDQESAAARQAQELFRSMFGRLPQEKQRLSGFRRNRRTKTTL